MSLTGSWSAGEMRLRYALDVSNEAEVRRLIEETDSSYGRLDYLFNNAGIAIGGDA